MTRPCAGTKSRQRVEWSSWCSRRRVERSVRRRRRRRAEWVAPARRRAQLEPGGDRVGGDHDVERGLLGARAEVRMSRRTR